jgi:WD40 repeat protein
VFSLSLLYFDLHTVSLEGTLSIWSASDGQCLASRSRVFKCAPRFIKLLPDQKRVAVAGYSSDIEILDLSSLKVHTYTYIASIISTLIDMILFFHLFEWSEFD